MMFERYGVPRGLAPHRSRTIRPVALASTIYCASLVGIRHPSRSDLVPARSVTVVTSSSPGSSRCQRCPACRFRSAFSAPLDAGSTLNVMEKRFPLATPQRKRLWTREVARPLRESLEDELSQLAPGDVLVIDMKGIEAFDCSFANEFFGKSILSLPKMYSARFL